MSPRPTTVNRNEVIKSIRDRVAGADEARTDRLQALAVVRETSNKVVEREVARLTAKHGAADPRVAHANMRMQAGIAELRSIRHEIVRSWITPPAAQDDAWVIFGMVRDANGLPVRGVTVALASEGGDVIAPNKPAPTEKDGAFQIVVPLGRAPAREREGGEFVEREKGDDAVVHLEVFRGESRRVVADTVTFRPTPGTVDYREIVVGSMKGSEKRPPR